jgi:FkbM family methyltransferase
MLPQYFIPSFQKLGREEVYVDCGAFIGDSFETYCQYNAPPQSAYLFEPDSKNLSQMKQALKKYEKDTQIHYIDKGVYHFTGTLFFNGGRGGQSCLTETPEKESVQLDVMTIDDAVEEEISFIKMDIEGSEQAALRGANRHIVSSYPRLAVCIYHGISDLWEIPLLIRDLFPEYNRYSLCHHDRSTSETVLYVYRAP